MRIIVALAAVVFLPGCASLDQPKWGWYRDGQTTQAFNMDMAQCRNEAMPYASTSLLQAAMVIDNCMVGKGWVKRTYPAR